MNNARLFHPTLLLLLLCTTVGVGPSRAAPGVDSLETFSTLPGMLNGRKVPMDTYARHVLLQYSGRSTLNDEPAVAWMARLLFTPHRTLEDKVFLINHPEVPEALGIEVDEHRRYSFSQIEPALTKLTELAQRAAAIEDEERSVVERELVRVYRNVNSYLGHVQTFQFAAPNPEFNMSEALKRHLGISEDHSDFSFLDVFMRIDRVREVIEPLQARDPETWSEFEQEAFRLSSALFAAARQHQHLPVAVIPVAAHDQEMWLSPWEAIAFGFQSSSVREEVEHLSAMTEAYLRGNQLEFDLAANAFTRSVRKRMADDRELAYHALEVLYNRLALFYRAEWLYGFAFLLAFASFLTANRWVRRAGWACLVLGFLPHTAGIGMRMLIMGRPPVTNLYATFLFVGWVSVLLSFTLERVQRNGLGLLIGSFGGLGLLLVAGRFATEGDQMGKVVAVLDSNFWLSTHVICITLGYAGCVVAGIIGHVYLLQAAISPGNRQRLRSIQWALFALLGFGLTFSFFGTMLGGVWADQSWGRFWGWDPKENGALLIVLWCAILFHARLAGMIGDLGMAVGSVLGIIVVMFAWIGVNLLGVGLHSYGFTSGLARGLAIYVGAQVLFLAAVVPAVRARTAKAS